ncbi:MAG: hypothetical protein JXR37_07440 [Kiritimatiellae bacterium]|nr:hypothetical protein [Kiritimatiellia bacterium]
MIRILYPSRCLTLLAALLLGLHGAWAAAPAPDTPERLTRRIVPEPKMVKPYGGTLALSPAAITVVFGAASPKTKIGAEEINKELYRLGFDTRARVVADAEYAAGDERLLVLVGAERENRLVRALWSEVPHRGELAALNEQGYIIDVVARRPVPAVVLAGASPQGSLYACVTFMQMLERAGANVVVHPLYARDWPDFKWRYLSHPAHFLLFTERAPKAAYPNGPFPDMAERGKEYVDWMLRYKINILRRQLWWGWNDHESTRAPWREFLAYAKARGILSWEGHDISTQGVGHCKTHEEFEKIRHDPKYKGLTNLSPDFRKYRHFITWSRDDLLEEKFRQHARECRAEGVDFTWFHAEDTGLSSFNYAKWKDRDELDKQRWGNDYGRAEAHVMNLARRVCREEAPDLKVVFVPYPYGGGILSDDFPRNMLRKRGKPVDKGEAQRERAFIRRFFDTLAREAPDDVWFCQRETDAEQAKRWADATRRPVMMYYSTMIPFCSSRARYIGTWYSEQHDNIYFFPSTGSVPYLGGLEMPMRMLLNAEYCWNTAQEGAAPFEWVNYARDLFEPEVVFKKIIPRACRAYWGDDTDRYWAPLFQGGLTPLFLEDPERFFKEELKLDFAATLEAEGNVAPKRGMERFADSVAEMRRQAEHLETALPPLEQWLTTHELKARDPFTHRYGTTLYLLAHYWRRMAAVWVPYMELKRLGARGEPAKRRALALQAQRAADAGLAAMQQVLQKTAAHPCLIPVSWSRGGPLDKKVVEDFDRAHKRIEKLAGP